MLVLSRKVGENIVIDSSLVVTVREVKGGRVRLAIEAPPEVVVLRGELVGKRPTRQDRDSPVEK